MTKELTQTETVFIDLAEENGLLVSRLATTVQLETASSTKDNNLSVELFDVEENYRRVRMTASTCTVLWGLPSTARRGEEPYIQSGRRGRGKRIEAASKTLYP